jgi:hypothetical protein
VSQNLVDPSQEEVDRKWPQLTEISERRQPLINCTWTEEEEDLLRPGPHLIVENSDFILSVFGPLSTLDLRLAFLCVFDF